MPYAKPDIAPEWVKISEVAATLGVDQRTVVRMIRRGDMKVRSVKLDRVHLIHRDDWHDELHRRIEVGVGA